MTKKCDWKHPVFEQVYYAANFCSCISGKPIYSPAPFNFHHGLEKGKFQELMYNPDNIFLMTTNEHEFAHKMTLDKLKIRIAQGEDWLGFLHSVEEVFKKYKETYKKAVSPKFLNYIELLNE